MPRSHTSEGMIFPPRAERLDPVGAGQEKIMAKRRQGRRITANVTDEQFEAVDEALSKLMKAYDLPSKNDALLYILKGMCGATETAWPKFVPRTEGRNFRKGKGGKFVKKS